MLGSSLKVFGELLHFSSYYWSSLISSAKRKFPCPCLGPFYCTAEVYFPEYNMSIMGIQKRLRPRLSTLFKYNDKWFSSRSEFWFELSTYAKIGNNTANSNNHWSLFVKMMNMTQKFHYTKFISKDVHASNWLWEDWVKPYIFSNI